MHLASLGIVVTTSPVTFTRLYDVARIVVGILGALSTHLAFRKFHNSGYRPMDVYDGNTILKIAPSPLTDGLRPEW